jgi:hypothetical protein
MAHPADGGPTRASRRSSRVRSTPASPDRHWRTAFFLVGVALLAVLVVEGPALGLDPQEQAEPHHILVQESTLAIVTFRAGLAGRFAHDHLVHAGDFQAFLVFDPDDPTATVFSGSLQVTDLVVDERERMERVQPVLMEFDLLPREFKEVGDGDRADIREEMLSEGQLDAANHPEVHFRSVRVHASEEDREFPWRIQAALSVKDRERATEMRARWWEEEGRIRIQAAGELHFTDFGIEPYRAFLGAVQNQDRFVLFLDLVVETAGEGR